MTQSSLRDARNHVARLREALLAPSPEAIARCLPGLIEAGECLGRVQQELGGGPVDGGLVLEVQAFQRELKIAAKLIEHGAALQSGWAKLLGAAVSGYLPDGEAAPLSAAGTISVRG